MSVLLRDPLMRHLLLNDYDQERQERPYRLQPIRVQHLGWPLSSSSFGNALSELQSVMDNVNEAIGNYQGSLVNDLSTGGMKQHRTEDGNLQVAIDVAQFKPEEIQVKVCDDNLVVEAKTETSENDSYHKAEFKRWIKLPADVRQEAIKSTLTPDKKLLIEVPVHKPIADSRSRNIPIQIQKQPVEDTKRDAGDQKQAQQTKEKK